MAWPMPTDGQRSALARDCPPPPALRTRLLALHTRRRRLRLAGFLAVPAVFGLGLLAGPLSGGPDASSVRAQAAAFEAAWRAEADFDWLQRDARARHLVGELRRLDEVLARDPDAPAALALWQARSRILSELLASRRDGRTAILL